MRYLYIAYMYIWDINFLLILFFLLLILLLLFYQYILSLLLYLFRIVATQLGADLTKQIVITDPYRIKVSFPYSL